MNVKQLFVAMTLSEVYILKKHYPCDVITKNDMYMYTDKISPSPLTQYRCIIITFIETLTSDIHNTNALLLIGL